MFDTGMRPEQLILAVVTDDSNPIYQPLRSGRIWHKVNF